MGDGAAVFRFRVGDPVNYFDTVDLTNPSPAPGFVTVVNGEDDFNVDITLADLSTRTEKHVGAQEPAVDPDPSPSVRWIELRGLNAGEL